MSEIVHIGHDDSLGEEEYYHEWFKCPNCQILKVETDFNYCPGCGRKIEWDEEVLKLNYYKRKERREK
jgi:hypothetical protein